MRHSSPTASIDVFNDIGLDFCRIVISFDIPNNFDGYDIIGIVVISLSFGLGTIKRMLMLARPIIIFSSEVTIVLPVLPLSSPFDIQAFHDPTKRSHTDFFEDAISIGDDTAISSLKVPDGIIMII